MKAIIYMIKKYKEILLYLVFGFLTTFVNIVSYYLLTRLLHLDPYISNIVAWILSVLFAFVTNKLLVFESRKKSWAIVLKEGIRFFEFRLLSLGIDMGSMFIMVSWCKIDDMIAKIIANIIVIILNYIFSKVFIFKKEN